MCPVEEHEVHESVKHSKDKPYGCNSDKKRGIGYWLQARQYRSDGTYVMRDTCIQNNMSHECRNYYLWYSDPGCAGCKRKKDREYANRMKGIK